MQNMPTSYFDFPSLLAKEPLYPPRNDNRHLFAWMTVYFHLATRLKQNFGNIHMIASKAVSTKPRYWFVECNIRPFFNDRVHERIIAREVRVPIQQSLSGRCRDIGSVGRLRSVVPIRQSLSGRCRDIGSVGRLRSVVPIRQSLSGRCRDIGGAGSSSCYSQVIGSSNFKRITLPN